MKKLSKIVSMLLLIVTFTMIFAACGANYDKIESKLKENEFTVFTIEGSDTSELSLNALAIYGIIGNTVAPSEIEKILIGLDDNLRYALVATLKTSEAVEQIENKIGDDALVKVSGKTIYITKDQAVMKMIK